MLSDKTLDEVLPVPDLQELKDQTVDQLKKEGFVVTNFSSGGVFYHLMLIALQVRMELVQLLRKVLRQMFVSSASGIWLELKAADFSKRRKAAVKTQGLVTVSRTAVKEQGKGSAAIGEAVKIAKGYIFKTTKDLNGEELRFLVTETTILQKDTDHVDVPVEAEQAGAKYNVAPGQINKCLIYLDGVQSITNQTAWITREGADTEDDESLRSRILGAWSELSTLPTRDKYKNVCEAVPGVLAVTVHDQHPRGQGTIDIVVTGTAGQATEGLLSDVRKATDSIKGPYDDVLVKSSETVEQEIRVTVVVPSGVDTTGLKERAEAGLIEYMRIGKQRVLYELYLFDIACAVRDAIAGTYLYKNIRVTTPDQDRILDNDKVITLGAYSVTVEQG